MSINSNAFLGAKQKDERSSLSCSKACKPPSKTLSLSPFSHSLHHSSIGLPQANQYTKLNVFSVFPPNLQWWNEVETHCHCVVFMSSLVKMEPSFFRISRGDPWKEEASLQPFPSRKCLIHAGPVQIAAGSKATSSQRDCLAVFMFPLTVIHSHCFPLLYYSSIKVRVSLGLSQRPHYMTFLPLFLKEVYLFSQGTKFQGS